MPELEAEKSIEPSLVIFTTPSMFVDQPVDIRDIKVPTTCRILLLEYPFRGVGKIALQPIVHWRLKATLLAMNDLCGEPGFDRLFVNILTNRSAQL